MKLVARLDPDQLDQLAELVVAKLLAARAPDTYDQDHLPAGISRRAYLESARRGAFAVAKIGKKIITRCDVLDAWIAAHARPPPLATSTDIDPDLAETIAFNRSRIRR